MQREAITMIKAKFYQTYYCCNIINNVLNDQFEYIRNLHEFYENSLPYLVSPFKKESTLHEFISFIFRNLLDEENTESTIQDRLDIIEKFKDVPGMLLDFDPYHLPIERALKYHDIEHDSFIKYLHDKGKKFATADDDDIYDYFNELILCGEIDELLTIMSREVFHVVFQNRELLLRFNEMMARAIELNHDQLQCEESGHLINPNGTLIRQRIPSWAKKAVYFRDRGRCVLCEKDLTGLLNIENQLNYDHIIPLARFGLNDVSNLQLLCKECNQNEKRDGEGVTSTEYQSWYSYDEE